MTEKDTTSSDAAAEQTEVTPPIDEQAGASEGAPSAAPEGPKPAPRRKAKSQPYLVWIGIVCLLAGAFAGWRVAERKRWYVPGAKNLTVMRNEPAMKEWTDKLREHGGPMCQAVADMLVGEQLPESIKERGINNFEDLTVAMTEGEELFKVCQQELIRSWDYAAWALAIAGFGMILLDILREKRMLPGQKRTPPA